MKYSVPMYTKKELVKEKWKISPDDPHYAVSDLGRIKLVSNDKIITQHINQSGYCTYRGTLAHRSIAKSFIPNPGNKETVNHIDGNKRNNRVTNLEWNTRKENTNHAVDNGLFSTNIKIELTDISINPPDVKVIRSLSKLCDVLNLTQHVLLRHIMYSRIYPIYNKYVVKLCNVNDLKLINKGGKKPKLYYVYDYINDTWTTYESGILLTYYTQLYSSSVSNSIKRKNYYLQHGYFIVNDMKYAKLQDINLFNAKVSRFINISTPIKITSRTYLLYDYINKVEYKLETIDDILEYLNNAEPKNIKIKVTNISNTLSYTTINKKTGLLKGYGLKSNEHDIPWFEYNTSLIIASKYGHSKKAAVYINEETGEYIVSNYELCRVLNLYTNHPNPRLAINNDIKKYGLEKIIKSSEFPDLKISRLT